MTMLLLAACPADDIPLLGHDSYEVREEAQARLWTALRVHNDRSVERQLSEHASHPDAEVRMRVRMMLAQYTSGKRPKQYSTEYSLGDEQWREIINSLPVGSLKFGG